MEEAREASYFQVGLGAYAAGLLGTFAANYLTKSGQPALVYIVPSLLLSAVATAASRGELPSLLEGQQARVRVNVLVARSVAAVQRNLQRRRPRQAKLAHAGHETLDAGEVEPLRARVDGAAEDAHIHVHTMCKGEVDCLLSGGSVLLALEQAEGPAHVAWTKLLGHRGPF